MSSDDPLVLTSDEKENARSEAGEETADTCEGSEQMDRELASRLQGASKQQTDQSSKSDIQGAADMSSDDEGGSRSVVERLKGSNDNNTETVAEGSHATNTEATVVGSARDVNLQHANVKVVANTIINKGREDFEAPCKNLKITYNPEKKQEYLKDAVLQWENVPSKGCKITILVAKVYSSPINSLIKDQKLSPDAKDWQIPNLVLEYGKSYKAELHTWAKYGKRKKKAHQLDFPFETMPCQPEKIDIYPQTTKVKVCWTVCEGADKYEVKIYDATGSKLLESLSFDDKARSWEFGRNATAGILPGRNYQLQVIPYRSDNGNPSKFKRFFFGTDFQPRNVSVQEDIQADKIKVEWKKPKDTKGLKQYQVVAITEQGKGSQNYCTENKETAKYIRRSGLKGGSTFNFRVSAIYHHEESGEDRGFSDAAQTIKTPPRDINVEEFQMKQNPDSPDTALDCTWKETAGAKCYEIKCKGPLMSQTIEIKGKTKATFSGLRPKSVYSFKIKAEKDEGYGSFSEIVEGTTALGKARNLKVNLVERSKLKTTFQNAVDASCHKVILRPIDEEVTVKGNSGESAANFNVEPNTTYSVEVIAIYSKGKEEEEGEPVQSKTVLTAPEPPLVDDIMSEPIKNHSDSSFTLFFEIDDLIESCQAEIKCEDENTKGRIIEMVTDKKESRAFLNYEGFYKGVVYTAKVRIRNSGGFSDWSGEKAIKTVPRKIAPFTICCDNEKVVAKWENVEHAESNTIILFKEGLEVCRQVHNVAPPFTFTEAIEHGLEYHCEIFPKNETGPGRTTKSNILLAPLDPPMDLKLKDENNQVTYTWTPSTGMRSSRITFSNSQLEKLELTTRETEWSYKVTNGEVYTFSIWAQTGKALSEDFVTEEFVTAPSAVIVRRNAINPETCLDVEVVTKYNGPFLLTWRDVEKTEKGKAEEVTIPERFFTIENLKPTTEYSVHAVCVFGKNKKKSKQCHSEGIMTMPAKVTGVTCTCHATEESKELTWDTCGKNSVQYTINWSRNNIFFEPITTETTTWKFKNLESGKYSFRVSAGGGKKSDECFVIIPDAPNMKLEIISWKAVRVVFSPKTLTEEKYQIKVTTSDKEKQLETKKCKFIIDKTLFTFEKGVEYTVTSRAFWKDQSGPATVMEFITGLDMPTEPTCKRDHDDPYRRVKFTWLNSVGMHSAKIQLRELDNQFVVEEITAESNWEYWGLEKNRTYEFFLWPGDGQSFFDNDCVRHKFTTAPDPPKSVCCAPYETGFRVEIESDFDGNFQTEVRNKDQTCVTEPRVGPEKSFVIPGLKPYTQYSIFTKCLFGKDDVDGTRETCADIQQSN